MRPDLAVYKRGLPDVVLLVEIKAREQEGGGREQLPRQLARLMWAANCPYGLIVTPGKTYVLRAARSGQGPSAFRVTDEVSTAAVFGKFADLNVSDEALLEMRLRRAVEAWLKHLTTAYEDALPPDQTLSRVFFPEIVAAVADGQVVSEAAA
jgi:hypothetical protein